MSKLELERRQPIGRLAVAACLLALLVVQCGGGGGRLVATGQVWRYWDQGGLDASPTWMTAAFSDATWPSGPSELGRGDGDEATVLGSGAGITTYFRRQFTVSDIPNHLVLDFKRDDAAMIYLNGVEIVRDNLPSGPITSQTLAVSKSGAHESRFVRVALDPSQLVVGNNVLAAEVHQAASSADISFDAELIASRFPFQPRITRGPYLQSSTPTSIVLRWRTDIPAESTVRYGSDPDELVLVATDATLRREHEISISGLDPGKRTYYSVGTTTRVLAGGDEDHHFWTPEPVGVRRPVRIWAVGDSGRTGQLVEDVRDTYLGDAGNRRTDVFLMLGDNAYLYGTDLEMQLAVFEVFSPLLRRTALWPSIGNHDAVSSNPVSESGPYFESFTLPAGGEAGGLPSGREAFYSFDFANVHFVVLDSEGSDRSPGGEMLSWLASDLAANQQDWTIAFFHRPLYSKGTHDSDTEGPMVQLRQDALPILEAGGVDLVLAGHSHAYERSMLIDGHYGSSDTLAPNMILDPGDGDPLSDGPYQKPTLGPAPHQGAVFVVAGSSSSTRRPGTEGPLDHPVMVRAENLAASVVVSVDRNMLEARVLGDTGAVIDRFRIEKPAPPDECNDGLDNDADGLTDHPEDPGCASAGASRENPGCDDGVDNDGDGAIDLGDPGCGNDPSRTREGSPRCGLGFELLLFLAPLHLARRRRRSLGFREVAAPLRGDLRRP